MTYLPPALLTGALDHLLRYLLTGCGQSAGHAALLLDRLATQEDMSEELSALCLRMCDTLDSAATPRLGAP